MNLHIDDMGGAGRPLLFIHGWGMHGGMWGDALQMLAGTRRVLAVDLPGHGYSVRDAGCRMQDTEKGDAGSGTGENVSSNPSPYSLDSIVDLLAARFAEPLDVCGWSLGGQIALRWAMRRPSQLRRLALVSSTPCFVQKPGWPSAMAQDTLAAFADALRQDHALTLRRFLALQVRGSDDERELLARLRNMLQSRGAPDPAALQSGLCVLRDTDFREELMHVLQPTLVIAGSRDTLTPPDASRYLACSMPNARLAEIGRAAHAPFLSHRDEFVTLIADFFDE